MADPNRSESSQQLKAALTLEAIRRMGGSFSAMIDGHHLHAGDLIGDARVVAIDAQGVTLERAGLQERLALQSRMNKTHRHMNRQD